MRRATRRKCRGDTKKEEKKKKVSAFNGREGKATRVNVGFVALDVDKREGEEAKASDSRAFGKDPVQQSDRGEEIVEEGGGVDVEQSMSQSEGRVTQ